MSLAGSAARGAATTLLGQGIRFLIQMASITILARLLAPSDFGVFAMVIAIVGVAALLGDFGLSMASIQSQTLTRGQRSNLFWTNTSIGIVLTAVIYVAAWPIAAFYDRPELVPITQVVSLTFLANALTAQFRAEVSSKLRFRLLAVTDVLGQAIALGAAVVIAIAGGGYWALVAQQLAIAVTTLVVLVCFSGWLPGLPDRKAPMKALYSYGANTLGVQVITYMSSNVDNILIGKVWGADALGVYSRAYQIFRLPLQQIAAPMTRVALPVLSRLQNDDRFDPYIQRAQVILSYTFGGVFFVLAAVSEPAIEILLGPGWGDAATIFAILAIGGVFQAYGYVYYWIFMSKALTGLQLRFTLVGRTVMIALMAVGVIWGPIGVAVGSTVGQAIVWAMNTLFAIPKAGVRTGPLVKLAMRPFLVYSVLAAIALALSHTVLSDLAVWPHLLILLAICSGYFGLVLLIVKPVRKDVALIWDVVKRVRKRS